jgi:DNA-directed RNA polymerase specialized sigma24 family protein
MRKSDRKRFVKELTADVDQIGGNSQPVDSQEVSFMDHAVESWVWWSYGVGPQEPISFARLVKMKSESVSGHLLKLTEEQYMALDSAIAKLPKRMQRVIEIEYREGGTGEQKAHRLGLTRREFRGRVEAMLSTLYGELLPDIQFW